MTVYLNFGDMDGHLLLLLPQQRGYIRQYETASSIFQVQMWRILLQYFLAYI